METIEKYLKVGRKWHSLVDADGRYDGYAIIISIDQLKNLVTYDYYKNNGNLIQRYTSDAKNFVMLHRHFYGLEEKIEKIKEAL
jgi:hypothetical protein